MADDAGALMSMIPGIDPDGALYPIEKMAAHRAGVLHLAVSVFVFDGPLLLIQQRAAGKYHCPGLWANSCCSHPHWGESPAVGARRRLAEELALDLEVTPGGVLTYRADVGDGLTEHERVHVYRAEAGGARVRPNPAEVMAVRWAEPGDLAEEALRTPHRFAPWFRIYLRRWDDLALTPPPGASAA
jgi:isopentenyl-diphosphate Delta-isomerase